MTVMLQAASRQAADGWSTGRSPRTPFLLEHAEVINYEAPYSSPLWRGRKCASASDFDNIAEVGCQPAASARANRLNSAGSPLLYVSATQFALFEELMIEEGEFIHVVAYSMSQRTMRAALLGEYTSVARWGRAMMGDAMSNVLRGRLNAMPFEDAKRLLYIDAFLSSVLKDKGASASEYIRSRVLAELIFERLPELDAITYPGVALEGAMNIAFKPASASRLLQDQYSSVLRLGRRYDYGVQDFELVRAATGKSP